MSKRVYLLTGAAGFLGTNIALQLLEKGCRVRALVLPGDKAAEHLPAGIEIVYGDLTDEKSLEPLFAVPQYELICIHCASIVYLKEEPNELVRRVNVDGTRNIIALCNKYNVKRLVYVSSTGTIPELPHGQSIPEPTEFELDSIVGYYSKTKAMATQLVLDAVKNTGLDASIVYPSGICGPNDYAHGPVSTFITRYCNGQMPVGTPGSFNSVDVRDLAAATIACVDKGEKGEGYILGNEVVSMQQMFHYISKASGAKLVKLVLPMPITRMLVHISSFLGGITHSDPMLTKLMVYNLVRNNDFDSSKARRVLGYNPRPFRQTIQDEVDWLRSEGAIPPAHGTQPRTTRAAVQTV